MFQRRSPRPATRISASTRRCTARTLERQSLCRGPRPAACAGSHARRAAERPPVPSCQMPETTATERDARHLQRAIELAGRARGQTSPNPIVGAVVVKDGRVLGEGITQPPGEQHAETMALDAAEGNTTGATLYVSLEPCCHRGRTPPCTDAIISAGIARVVIASDDPTPKAAGRGPGILRDEGVRVDFVDGDIADAARMLNQPFRKHARTGRPLVVFKSAMTLDGKVATRTGDSKWISSEGSRAVSHRWRASMDAVAVGIGTALADDPQLTARIDGVHHQPRRVRFDSTARLPLDSKLVAAAPGSTDALETAGAHVIVATGQNEPARIASALDQLGALDPPVTSMLLEG